MILIAGASITRAPAASSCLVKALACARALVTTIVLPKRGLLSNHCSCSRSLTTLPTIKIAGGFRFAAATSAAAVPTVVIRVRCSGLVPQRMTAAGVSALRPLAMRFFVILVRFSTPIRKTKVSTAVARPLQLIVDSPLVGSSWPVMTAKEVAT